MVLPYVVVGAVGLVLAAAVLPMGLAVGSVWFVICCGVGVALALDRLVVAADRHVIHMKWFEKIEGYRLIKQYPNAAKEINDADAAKKAAAVEAEQKRQNAAADRYEATVAEREAKREAKRKAAEPTFVSEELVPEIPPDFKPRADVDFTALEEVARPRRKRE